MELESVLFSPRSERWCELSGSDIGKTDEQPAEESFKGGVFKSKSNLNNE